MEGDTLRAVAVEDGAYVRPKREIKTKPVYVAEPLILGQRLPKTKPKAKPISAKPRDSLKCRSSSPYFLLSIPWKRRRNT